MKKVFYFAVIAILGITVTTHAEMKLKLSQDITGKVQPTFGNSQMESNLKLDLPAIATNPAGNELLKVWLVGLAADATIPVGDLADGWSTGFSAHAMVGYMIARSILLQLSVGYIKFSEKESVEGVDNSYSWVPIAIALNYVFNPGKKFMPFVGLALALYLISYSYSYSVSVLGTTYSDSFDDSTTKFGIAPQLGVLYQVSKALLLTLRAQFHFVFTEGSNSTALGLMFGFMYALH
jgi:outer membrane protein W